MAQGTQVGSLVREDPTLSWSNSGQAPQLLNLCPRACVPQEKPPQREAHAPQKQAALLTTIEDPAQPKMVNQSKNFFADPNKLIFAGEMTGRLFVLGQELKQKNYPPTSSLTTTVAGLGVRHSPNNLPESPDLPSESSKPISKMDLHSREAVLKAQCTLLALEYAVTYPWDAESSLPPRKTLL